MPAYYLAQLEQFMQHSADEIIGTLTSRSASQGFHQQEHDQTRAWHDQVRILKDTFSSFINTHDTGSWHVLFEFLIPRRGRRVDVVLLAADRAIVIEFKCGSSRYDVAAKQQVEDYCLDLRDFHKPSHSLPLYPVLFATHAPDVENQHRSIRDGVADVLLANKINLYEVLKPLLPAQIKTQPLDAIEWDQGEYLPTPTIVEAAKHLYSGQNVREISRCHGGTENLTKTTEAILGAIRVAQRDNEKLICFITGVPGAGKTLAGLNVVHNHKLHEGDLGSFLSGNGPLVKVLTEALAKDYNDRTGVSIETARREVATFIHNVHRFIDNYYNRSKDIPVDKVVVFDEAQRAWDSEQSDRKFKRPYSESELMLSIMDRHEDWAVIVALIGEGQEINSGEAGLSEWGRTIVSKFPNWKVMVSPLLLRDKHDDNDGLFKVIPTNLKIVRDSSLHLDVSMRAYRAEMFSEWVSSVLQLRPDIAKEKAKQLEDFPIVMTRSLDTAKQWLKKNQRGSRRIGLVASSGARRLRAMGLDVTSKIDVENWFLKPSCDIRSSFSLETIATEFDIQGLELDWTCLCWGLDLVPDTHDWGFNQFIGTKWRLVNNAQRKRFILNKYRVLLTRAREGMAIYVPKGDKSDYTRQPERYELCADYLRACGVETI